MRRLPTFLTLLIVSLGLSVATTQAAVSRSGIAETVTQACSGGGSGCMAAVDDVLSQFGRKCRIEDRIAAQGLADAVLAISQTNTDLAIDISKRVVLKAKNCFQTAYAEILDGTGTAAVTADPESGSPG